MMLIFSFLIKHNLFIVEIKFGFANKFHQFSRFVSNIAKDEHLENAKFRALLVMAE